MTSSPTSEPARTEVMRAVVKTYGSPNALRLVEIAKPTPNDDQILIRIHSVSINGSDRGRLAKPFRPRKRRHSARGPSIFGSDIAGRVESVGQNIREFKPGDEVFGEIPGYRGGFAEYVCTSGRTMALKPTSLSFERAAAIPQGGVIALRGIRVKGKVQPGHKVLINGAGGSAGSFAIQLAKLHGAEVTGVDHTRKLDFMRYLGADHVIDYTKDDFTRRRERYDLILDLFASRSMFACQRALARNGTYFFVGGSDRLILQIPILGPLIRGFTSKHVRMLWVPQNRTDLIAITDLVVAGKIAPAIDRRFRLEEAPEAMRYVEEGRAKGKVVITVADDIGVGDSGPAS